MTKSIDIGAGYDRLAEAMDAEGIFQIRHHKYLRNFTVEMVNGQIGGGKTVREAVEDAASCPFYRSEAA